MKRVALILSLWPTVCLACSGPGAQQFIAESKIYGLLSWAAVVLLATFSWLTPKPRSGTRNWSVAMTIMAGIHPGWWMDTNSGDCGITDFFFSFVFAALAAIIFGLQAIYVGREFKKESEISVSFSDLR
jgi:hypothetical protein